MYLTQGRDKDTLSLSPYKQGKRRCAWQPNGCVDQLSFSRRQEFWGGGSVTLAIILFVITGLEHYWDHNIRATIFAALGIIFFCGGAYIAWSKERDKYEAEVAKSGSPRFELDLGQLHVFYQPSSNQTYVLLSPTLTNHGATSGASFWQISFNSPMLRIQVPYSNLPDPTTRWLFSEGRRALILRNDKMLPVVTSEAVESGHTKYGRILFELPGDLVQNILNNPSNLYLGCSNRLGQVTWQGCSTANIMTEFAILPGEETVNTEAPAALMPPA